MVEIVTRTNGKNRIRRAHNAPISAVAFSPDAKRVASVSISRNTRNNAMSAHTPSPLDDDWEEYKRRNPGYLDDPPDSVTRDSTPNAPLRTADVLLDDGTLPEKDAFGDGPNVQDPSCDYYNLDWAIWDVETCRCTQRGATVVRLNGIYGKFRPSFIVGANRLAIARERPYLNMDGAICENIDYRLCILDLTAGGRVVSIPKLLGEPEFQNGSSVFLLTPDGKSVLVGDKYGNVRILKTEGEREIQIIRAHPTWITALAVDPSGTRLVTAAANGAVTIWDLDTRADVLSLREPGAPRIQHLAFSPDSCRLVGCDRDGRFFTWEASPVLP